MRMMDEECVKLASLTERACLITAGCIGRDSSVVWCSGYVSLPLVQPRSVWRPHHIVSYRDMLCNIVSYLSFSLAAISRHHSKICCFWTAAAAAAERREERPWCWCQSITQRTIDQSINQHCSNTTTLCNQQQQQQTEEKRDQSCCDADDTDGCVGRLCDVKQVIEQSLIVVLSKQLKLVQNKHHWLALCTACQPTTSHHNNNVVFCLSS